MAGGEKGEGLGLRAELGRDEGVKVTGLVGRPLIAGFTGGASDEGKGTLGEAELVSLLVSAFWGGVNSTGLGMKEEGAVGFFESREAGEGLGGRAGAA